MIEMITAVVEFHIKDECIEDFRKISLENAAASIKEPGVTGFNVLQAVDDASHFALIETYLTPDDQQKHRTTAHYLKWNGQMGDMLAEPRVNIKYNVLNG
jgi:quinol monooxygenase YgiN